MVKVTFIDSTGVARVVDGDEGTSVMSAGKQNNVPELEADCGGACTCATCHVYVAPEWLERAGAASKLEDGLLSMAGNRQPNSRLSCQIKLSSELEGLVVFTPEAEEE